MGTLYCLLIFQFFAEMYLNISNTFSKFLKDFKILSIQAIVALINKCYRSPYDFKSTLCLKYYLYKPIAASMQVGMYIFFTCPQYM